MVEPAVPHAVHTTFGEMWESTSAQVLTLGRRGFLRGIVNGGHSRDGEQA